MAAPADILAARSWEAPEGLDVGTATLCGRSRYRKTRLLLLAAGPVQPVAAQWDALVIKGVKPEDLLGELSAFERKHAPAELYAEGDTSLLTTGLRVSVVGSRNATAGGIRRAKAVTKALVRHRITVVSGLAEGIDTVAHSTAIEEDGRTIAVLGTPLSQAYPAANEGLLDIIKRDHLAISQFPEGHPAKKDNFPRRNRTMALISDATIIVEASEFSGTRHQGWEAIRLGRIVYIMQSVAEDSKLTWPKEMISYGAQVLTREHLSEFLLDIPSFTSGGNATLSD